MDATSADHEGSPAIGPTGHARIVEMRPGGPGPSFVLVPGTGGRIEGFDHLANALETLMPVYAIEARGVDGSSTPDSDIEVMACHYVDRLRSLRPSGPYFLAGHSFGGLVAFEMAQVLVQAGESVPALMMLDTPVSEKFWPLPFYLANLKNRAVRHLGRLFTVTPGENLRYYFRRLLLRRYGLLNIPPEIKIGSNTARVMLASDMARWKYNPKFYPGKLVFFQSREAAGFENLWCGRVGTLEVYPAKGGHIDMIDPPYVGSMAETMSACLALRDAIV